MNNNTFAVVGVVLCALFLLPACPPKGEEVKAGDSAQAGEKARAEAAPRPALPPAPPPKPEIAPPPDVSGPPAGAEKTASGLVSKVLGAGTGTEKPRPEDSVRVHYTGWTTDGKMFDSSVLRGRPITFPLKQVIPGWTEGVGLMVVGEKRRLWIPEELAYKGKPGRPQGMLVFDVELISFR
jgi:peptidylprolyl isomerase